MSADFALYTVILGFIVILIVLLRAWLDELGIPPITAYFMLGFLLRLADEQWMLLGSEGRGLFEFMGYLGVIALLFRVGLESDLMGLKKRLPEAVVIWSGDVLVSGLVGFTAARWLLGWTLVQSLFTGIALTATSVGITSATWRGAGLLNTADGERLLDVAEMDDISGVLMMALLFAVAPALRDAGAAPVYTEFATTVGIFVFKLAVFVTGSVLFARYAEERITAFLEARMSDAAALLGIAGVGLIVAAIAALLGFSAAIGAFFAGIIFSRDPKRLSFGGSMDAVHSMLVAFFFIGIGLHVDPGALSTALGAAAVLLAAAFVGKMIGAGTPALFQTGLAASLVLGLSLVPRAEIALIVMQHGLDLGDWAVNSSMFANMVAVSFVTALAPPLLLRWIFASRPEIIENAG